MLLLPVQVDSSQTFTIAQNLSFFLPIYNKLTDTQFWRVKALLSSVGFVGSGRWCVGRGGCAQVQTQSHPPALPSLAHSLSTV